jgi:hypothetical protein
MSTDLKSRLDSAAQAPSHDLDMQPIVRRARARRRYVTLVRVAAATTGAVVLVFGITRLATNDKPTVRVEHPTASSSSVPPVTQTTVAQGLNGSTPVIGVVPTGYRVSSEKKTTDGQGVKREAVTLTSTTAAPITVDQWSSENAASIVDGLVTNEFETVRVRAAIGHRHEEADGSRVLVWLEFEFVALRIHAPNTVAWDQMLAIAAGIRPSKTSQPVQIVHPPLTPGASSGR